MILVTGPTGSGKTTTLYAALRHLNKASDKLISIEDPIEYQIDGVTQIQVKPEIELDFARVLRSVVRHDPDVIMVGETRDPETADIAVHAALTGHLLLTTLHTNSAAGAVARLLDMGVEPYLLASVLRGDHRPAPGRHPLPGLQGAPRPATPDEARLLHPGRHRRCRPTCSSTRRRAARPARAWASSAGSASSSSWRSTSRCAS